MRWSPSSVLQAVTPHLPAELVGGGQLEPCRQIAAELRTAVDGFYFECRLDDDPRVDFLVLTGNRLGAAPQLEATLGPERAAGAWQRNLSLLRGWAGADAALEGAPAAWLEYDIDARFDARAPVASPSLCVESSYFSRFVADPTIDHESARRRAYGALRHLVSESRRARVEQVVSDCIAALPEGGSLVYVSEMLTREPSVTKLYVALSKARVCEFLRSIAWPGERSQVDDILRAQYAAISSTAFLDLSVSQQILPRLGFAFSQFHRREMSCFDPSWSWLPMPRTTTRKRSALASWPGETALMLDGARCVLRRWVDIKLVLGETGDLSFKAYLGFMPALPGLFD